MLKRLLLSLAFVAALLSPAFGAGTVPGFSLQRMVDNTGAPLVNCKLYVIQAGTTSTPQNAYQDSALTIPLPNPISCDGNGWLPQFFVADGSIKLRLTDTNGNQQLVADNILVVGPSGGSGGAASVDPTTILATGDMKIAYGTGSLSGFVRCNGRTIGSATSGATERANVDTQALFEFLWNADPNLVVAGGRGTSAAADWSANKTITLPDCRDRALAGLGDMGNSDAALYSGVTFSSGNGTTLGSTLGTATETLAQSALPNVAPTFTGSLGTATSTSSQILFNNGNFSAAGGGGQVVAILNGNFGTVSSTFTPSGTVGSINGNVAQTAVPTVAPRLLVTIYIKL